MTPETIVLAAAAHNSSLSSSFAEHPLQYMVSAGAVIAVMLFVIFDSNSSLGDSITWALFSSPVSVTVLAVVFGVVLADHLPVIIDDNFHPSGGISATDLGRYVGAGAGVLAWLIMISGWMTKRKGRRRGRMGTERPLSAELLAKLEAESSYSKRHERPSTKRRLPPRH